MPGKRTDMPLGRAPALVLVLLPLGLLAAMAANSTDSMSARRQLVARMSAEEQQELLQKQERFAALPPAEQDRLRQLQAAVDAEPDARRLHEILARYHEWLKTLSPSQRAELADRSPESRIQMIKQIQQSQQAARQQTERAKLLTPQDVRSLLNWSKQIAWTHREALMEEMSSTMREKFDRSDPQKQHEMLLFYVVNRYRGRGGPRGLGMINQKNLDQLAEKLSPEARRELTEAATLDERREIARGWVWTVVHRMTPRGPRSFTPGMDEEVVQFFEHELLPAQRQGLLNKPNDLTRDELRRLYLERGHNGPGTGNDGRPPDRDRPRGVPHRPPGDRQRPPET